MRKKEEKIAREKNNMYLVIQVPQVQSPSSSCILLFISCGGFRERNELFMNRIENAAGHRMVGVELRDVFWGVEPFICTEIMN